MINQYDGSCVPARPDTQFRNGKVGIRFMKEKKEMKTARKPEPKFWQSVLVLLITVALIAVALLVEKVDYVHAALFLAAVVAVLASLMIGFKWSALEKMMIDGISRSLQSIMILLVIGMMIGVWMRAGVVPAMIYYGLKIMRPGFFLAAVMVICSISSIATGSSWGTAASMGIAFLGISHGLGINPAITAGAVISGAYFGDKMSPLSDTTNLAPAMAGTDVMTHVKFMLLPTGITYIVTLAIFALMPLAANANLLGFHSTFYTGTVGAGDMSVANALGEAIKQAFPNINPLLMLPPLVVIVAIALKLPAIPGITLGVFAGAILGLIFQKGCNVSAILNVSLGGYSLDSSYVYSGFIAEDGEIIYDTAKYGKDILETVNTAIRELLDGRGGISSMGDTISLVLIAMMYGGIMEGTGMLAKLVGWVKKFVKTPGSVVAITEGTCIFSNIVMPDQYVSIVVGGRMYGEDYEKMGLYPAALSNALESSATITSALVPWNTCGAYMTKTLGPIWGPGGYGPWAIFNWLMPIMNVILAYMGISVADKDGVRLRKKKRLAKKELKRQKV